MLAFLRSSFNSSVRSIRSFFGPILIYCGVQLFSLLYNTISFGVHVYRSITSSIESVCDHGPIKSMLVNGKKSHLHDYYSESSRFIDGLVQIIFENPDCYESQNPCHREYMIFAENPDIFELHSTIYSSSCPCKLTAKPTSMVMMVVDHGIDVDVFNKCLLFLGHEKYPFRPKYLRNIYPQLPEEFILWMMDSNGNEFKFYSDDTQPVAL